MLNAIGTDPENDDQSTFANIDDFYSTDLRLSYAFSIPKAAPAPAVVDAKDAKDGKNVAPAVQGATGCDWKAKLLDGLTLAVGCNNVFNMQPPFISGANSNTDLSLYDGFGRFVYFEISKKF